MGPCCWWIRLMFTAAILVSICWLEICQSSSASSGSVSLMRRCLLGRTLLLASAVASCYSRPLFPSFLFFFYAVLSSGPVYTSAVISLWRFIYVGNGSGSDQRVFSFLFFFSISMGVISASFRFIQRPANLSDLHWAVTCVFFDRLYFASSGGFLFYLFTALYAFSQLFNVLTAPFHCEIPL